MRRKLAGALVLWLLTAACSRATPPPTLAPSRTWMANPPAGPTATESPTQSPTALATPRLSFRLINTGIEVSLAYGHIAWSHSGKYIAYVSRWAIHTVPVGRWSEATVLYRGSSYDGQWGVGAFALAWSPDDRKIGFTRHRYLDDGVTSVFRMGQADVATGEASFLGPEETKLLDWSATNEVVGFHDDEQHNLVVLDLATGEVRTLVPPMGGPHPHFARWMPDGRLLVAKTKSLTAAVLEAEFYRVDWRKNRWELLSFLRDQTLRAIHPVASPDGRWIAWINDDDSVMMYDRQTDQFRKVAWNANGSYLWAGLTWAPDSKRLALSAEARSTEPRMLWAERTLWILEPDLPE